MPIVQYQKWQSAVKYLQYASLHNLGLKNGGTKQTIELHRRALEKYDAKNGSAKGSKLQKDPLFIECIDSV